jgi:hypothetical protein
MKISLRFAASALFAGTSLLSVFSSTANASWRQLPYEVTYTDITPATGQTQPVTTTGTDPQRGGTNTSNFIGATLIGKVKAKFEWTHDMPGDVPPPTCTFFYMQMPTGQLTGD